MDLNYYKEIGFLCGLEIHQRLLTKQKLFCSCSSQIDEDERISSVSRFQRAVSGETGKIDKSAEFEDVKNKKFVYNLYKKHSCLVDIDEEPPHQVNNEALELAIGFANALNMKIFNELQVMRKVIVDGSDPSAFQRTILIGHDGFLKIQNLEIPISSISLEEESSKIISSSQLDTVYDISRLGIPLIEIDTDFHIPTPLMVKQVALHIGKLLRISGFVQRGIGSIRQDVNVSIKNGARVEIKGFQEIANMEKFIENEIIRQQKLIEIKNKLNKANAGICQPKDVTHLFENTNVRLIKDQIANKNKVFGIGLKNFKGILGTELNPDRRFGSEISDYAKISGVNGIIHSDENLSKYNFSIIEIKHLSEELALSDNDAFILIADEKQKTLNAIKFMIQRLKYAFIGIPEETRVALNNNLFTTKFLRPVPGRARMYPETDLKSVFLDSKILKRSFALIPNIENEERVLKAQLNNNDLADQLLMSQKYSLYKIIINKTSADPNTVANILIQKFTELKRNGFNVDNIKEEQIIELFKLYAQDKITKQAIEEILKELSKNIERKAIELIKQKSLYKISDTELIKIIGQVSKESKIQDKNKLRDLIMQKYRLNIDGSKLNEILNTL
ncbi:MAG: Glu-tRNA(Gln) amidotransferase subunit GatE [Candidatus Marsarchaeota archaeon]|nr:Glu-tRNA(Gln) amidotransferase subunit GatE [Candidatus Marsarchaeota archaeon]MCL5095037.1 Glu-tRNA(Gln) amidotransferase subunit GatE [Candidatus Marsarchaeota archaeon]